MNLYAIFQTTCQAHPEDLAMGDIDATYTYAELAVWVEEMALGFQRLGLKPGDRVLVLLKNRPVALAVLWALMAIGAVMVPASPEHSPHSLRGMVQDAEPQAVIYESLARGCLADILGTDRPLLIGVHADDADIDLAELPRLLRGQSGFRAFPAEPNDVAVILYTTGTTGSPKGVPRTHRNTIAAASAHIVQHHYDTSDRMLGVMPLSHTMGLHLYVAATLLGVPCWLVSEFDPDLVSATIQRHQISTLYQTPFWYYALLNAGRADRYDLSTVTKVGYAGSVMHEDLIEAVISRFNPRVFVNHYGSTEIYTHTVGDMLLRVPGTVGKPGLNATVRIDGAESPETVGEVLVRLASPEAFRGYWNRPELTRSHLNHGWYRTGDLGYSDSAGNFFVVGRTDEVIISGGEHIYPQWVETILADHPKVLEVAVSGEPDNRWGQVVVAYVVPRVPGLRVFDLDAYCKQQPGLSVWARPRKYVFVRQIPKTATGKILRRELGNLEGGV